MEFFLGIVFTVFTMGVIGRFIMNQKLVDESKVKALAYSQSHVFELIKPAIPYLLYENATRKTQSQAFESAHTLKVIFSDSKAYWIKDNSFYEANVINGEIDNSTAKTVDTINMDKVELDKIIFIVDKLTEGTANDGRGSGV